MAVRLRDINPVIMGINGGRVSIGHSTTPDARLDVRHDTDENKTIASFTNPDGATDGRTTSVRIGKGENDGESAKLSYIHDTTSGNQEFRISHEGDAHPLGLLLRKGGNVGVGVPTSAHKLHVGGNAMVDNKVIGQSAVLQLDTETNPNSDAYITFKLADSEKMNLNSYGLGINAVATATEKLKINGKINILDALLVNGTTVINSSGYVPWDRVSGEPGWLNATQANVQVGGFGGSLGWSKVGVTNDTKPSWLDDSQTNINLSGFTNDLGPTSQWTDKSTAYGQSTYQGIYYTGSSNLLGRVTLGDTNVVRERLYVKDDDTWQLRLRNSATGGSDWYFGVNATNKLAGTGGKLLLSYDGTYANSKFAFTNAGALWVNTSPTETDTSKFIVGSGDAFFKNGNVYHRGSTDQIVIMDSQLSSSDYSVWWYMYTTGSSGKLGWYRGGDKMTLDKNGGLSINRSSVSSGYKLHVNGSALATSFVAGSDENKKTDITESDLGLEFIERLNPVKYKWKDYTETIPLKRGESKQESYTFKRHHYGFTAQQVKVVMDAVGIEDFGGYKDTSVAEPDKPAEYSLDYQQFIAPLVKAVQELSEKVKNLENAANAA